ncbi:MAG: PHP domain-containing protein [Clostridia bacterium]|nr:PHP domain-containing protein [Clostridia bacterium]
MKYKRLELHNHTTESDAVFSCEELIDFLAEDHVDGFALTDHNTISGHAKIKNLLAQKNVALEPIYGMEYTTYYGHILCFNLTEYVPWENINKHKPELLFEAARNKGAIVGIAHPFSVGWPFSQGCRFEMTVTDYSKCDFIEVFNNLEDLHKVNEKALILWEKLIFSGEHLAATCGMDLHGNSSLHGHYSTYIEGDTAGDIGKELENAIHSQRTWISKGPLLVSDVTDDQIIFSVLQTGKPGYTPPEKSHYLISVKTASGESVYPIPDTMTYEIPLSSELLKDEKCLIIKLYEQEAILENLVCISPVLYL